MHTKGLRRSFRRIGKENSFLFSLSLANEHEEHPTFSKHVGDLASTSDSEVVRSLYSYVHVRCMLEIEQMLRASKVYS